MASILTESFISEMMFMRKCSRQDAINIILDDLKNKMTNIESIWVKRKFIVTTKLGIQLINGITILKKEELLTLFNSKKYHLIIKEIK